MRSLRIAAVSLIAASGLLLAGCGDDDEPAADSTSTSASSTPSEETSATPTDSSTDDSEASAEVGEFAEVEGFTLVSLPSMAQQQFSSAVSGVPQIQGFEGRLAEKDGKKIGLVIRIGVDEEAAAQSNFESGFLPGFAQGIAGTSAKPEFEEIDGVNVVKIGTPDGSGTAYAWIEGNVATVTVFQDAADAQTYAEGAIGQ